MHTEDEGSKPAQSDSAPCALLLILQTDVSGHYASNVSGTSQTVADLATRVGLVILWQKLGGSGSWLG